MAMFLHTVHFRRGDVPRGLSDDEARGFFEADISAQPRAAARAAAPIRFGHSALVLEGGQHIPVVLAEVARKVEPYTGKPVIVVTTRGTESASEGIDMPQLATHEAQAVGGVMQVRPPSAPCARLAFRRLGRPAEVVPTPPGQWLLSVEVDAGEDEESTLSSIFQCFRERGAILMDLKVRLAGSSLGNGSYASIYLADVSDCRRRAGEQESSRVALKVYKRAGDGSAEPGKADDEGPSTMTEFRCEVQMLLAVQGHRNIIGFQGVLYHRAACDDGDAPETFQMPRIPSGFCVMMEHCVGGDLFRKLRERGSGVGEVYTRGVAQSLLRALEHIHGRGVLHRDIKLANILLRGDGSVALADFGLSCRISDKEKVMRGCGTPGYMAPEVISQKGARPESDIFGVGVVLYALLCGRLPFAGRDVKLVLARTVQCQLRFSHQDFERVGIECRSFLGHLMEKEWQRRPTAAVAHTSSWLKEADIDQIRKNAVRTCDVLKDMDFYDSENAPSTAHRSDARGADSPATATTNAVKRQTYHLDPIVITETTARERSTLPRDAPPSREAAAASTRGFFVSAKAALGRPIGRMMKPTSMAVMFSTRAHRSGGQH